MQCDWEKSLKRTQWDIPTSISDIGVVIRVDALDDFVSVGLVATRFSAIILTVRQIFVECGQFFVEPKMMCIATFRWTITFTADGDEKQKATYQRTKSGHVRQNERVAV